MDGFQRRIPIHGVTPRADGTPRGVDLQSRVGVCALVSPCELRSAKVATFKADCNVRAFLFQQD